jgi:hypothetical protein
MKITLLHLSDIHIKSESDAILTQAKSIAAAAFEAARDSTLLLVFVSGDIAFSGTAAQYIQAERLLRSLIDQLAAEATSCRISLVTIPGNHDCNFDENNDARNLTIGALTTKVDPSVDDSVIDICTSVQRAYFEFRNRVEPAVESGDRLLWSRTFTVSDKKVTIHCLNSAWLSQKQETIGQLYFPIRRYSDLPNDSADVRIGLIHHPAHWVSTRTYREFRRYLHSIADLLLTGHEHEGNAGTRRDTESDETAFIEGSVLQKTSNELTGSSFYLVDINLNDQTFRPTKYTWSESRYSVTEHGSWRTYVPLPAKRATPFPLLKSFVETLEDPGPYFARDSSVRISIHDIFVFPVLKKSGVDIASSEFLSAELLLEPERIKNGVLIEGDDRSGKSTLLHKLFLKYHNRGYVPLLLRGRDVGKTAHSISNATRKAVEMQYGREQVEPFLQLSKSNRVLLLDDFDEGSLKSAKARREVLFELRKQFDYVVITVGEFFAVQELLDNSTEAQVSSITQLTLEPFGFSLRGELIVKWCEATEPDLDDNQRLAQRDNAEKLIDGVMGRLVPSVPLFIFTLLQSWQMGQSADFGESALGHYYHYLLSAAFFKNGVKAEKLTELFHYCAQLAWFYYKKGAEELLIGDLEEFNERFSSTWTRVDFSDRLRLLLDARVLRDRSGAISFRYPYMFFYLKGQYLSENLADPSIRDYIARCCAHLYVRDYANTVLFLAHHTRDGVVLTCIERALQGLFGGRVPLTFQGDTTGIADLIMDAPKLMHSGATPEEVRSKHNEARDEGKGLDGALAETEETSDTLSLPAQIVMLFKTIEILGQLLKNQYSVIQHTRKTELIKEIFNGPLRAVADFVAFTSEHPAAILAVVEAEIEKQFSALDGERRQSVARRIVASTVLIVVASFLFGAADSVGSSELSEDINSAVDASQTVAFRMIRLAVILDSSGALPRALLDDLYRDVSHDRVCTKLLEIIILRRLYMFHTDYKDMQWLADKFKLDIDYQRKIGRDVARKSNS